MPVKMCVAPSATIQIEEAPFSVAPDRLPHPLSFFPSLSLSLSLVRHINCQLQLRSEKRKQEEGRGGDTLGQK